MADITKCAGQGCDIKEQCYRYTAPSSEYRQAWNEFWVYLKHDDRGGYTVCEHFYSRS